MSLPATLPTPRTPDPLAAPGLRWGIIGTGWIADRFVTALAKHSSQQVVAVGSRTQSSAQSFADGHSILTAYGSYEQLVADPDVDVVYVATPHNTHLPVALLSLGAGKHTLIEKPIGATADEARQIESVAKAAGVFCMALTTASRDSVARTGVQTRSRNASEMFSLDVVGSAPSTNGGSGGLGAR